MILNFGKNRCPEDTAGMNKELLKVAKKAGIKVKATLPTEIYVGAAIKQAKYRPFKEMYTKSYISESDAGIRRRVEYLTTIVRF